MSVDFGQFRVRVLRPVLGHLGLDSPVAEALVLGTMAQESGGVYLAQKGSGPALGLFQIEPHTEADVWENYLQYRSDLAARVRALVAQAPERALQLASNLAYGTAICRIIYARVPAPLPPVVDPTLLGRYWKQHYNTPGGAGTVDQFIASYRRLVAPVLG